MYGLLGIYIFKKHLGFSRCTSIVRITSGARNFVETITQVLVISVVFFSVCLCILMNYEGTIIIYCLASTLYCILQPRGLRYALYCKCDASSPTKVAHYTKKKFFTKWISSLVKRNLFLQDVFYKNIVRWVPHKFFKLSKWLIDLQQSNHKDFSLHAAVRRIIIDVVLF